MNKKWNLVDVIIIGLFVVICVGGFYFLNQGSEQVSNIVSGKEKIQFVAEAERILPEVTDSVHVGDHLVAVGKYQDALITDVQIYDQEDIKAVDGKIVAYKDPSLKRVVVTMEATVNRYGPYYEFGGQQVKAGSYYWIKTDKMHMYGMIVKVY